MSSSLSHFTTDVDTQQLACALRCYAAGNLPQAELIARSLMEQFPSNPSYPSLLGDVALQLGLPQYAAEFYNQALALDPHWAPAQQGHLAASQAAPTPQRSQPQFLLIKAWGYGFWSDVDHVLGALLVAELTGRMPIVHWGRNSLFGAGDGANAWPLYFEPVSAHTLQDLQRPDMTFYPAKWQAENLLQEDVNKWSGVGACMSALFFLARTENVVVSDFYTGVTDLLPWLPKGHAYANLSPLDIYRRLAAKYLKPQAQHLQKMLSFLERYMHIGRWLAVHVRGSDKVVEVAQLEQLNQHYFGHIDQLLGLKPEAGIFLITDSQPLLAQFKQRYPGRVLTTDCLRSSNEVGVHYAGHTGLQVGSEVLLDTLLAAHCDFFLGNGTSNVSLAVRYLKPWPQGHCVLLGADMHAQRNRFLHDW